MITIDDLTLAIEHSIDSDTRSLEHEEAFDLAQHVLNFFGYSNRIIDNVLEPEDRDAFYMLEDSGVLMTEREEITLYDGREWRIHYWLFRNDKIKDLILNDKPKQVQVTEEPYDPYKELPPECWVRKVEEEE